MFSSYGKLSAEVYDIDKPLGSSFGEIEFYSELLADVTGYVLEPAVGSGRVLIPLLQRGFKIEGFDTSPQMLESCMQRLIEAGLRSEVWLSNMSNFSSQREYEAIIIPTGSFLLIEDRAETIEALTRFFKQLKPGGRLLVDLFMPSDFEFGRVFTKTWQTQTEHIITMESKLIELDFFHQRTVTYLKYEKWKQGSLLETELQKFVISWYGIEEFRALLERVGFEEIRVYADYDASRQPSSEARVFTFDAKRA